MTTSTEHEPKFIEVEVDYALAKAGAVLMTQADFDLLVSYLTPEAIEAMRSSDTVPSIRKIELETRY